MKWSEYYQSFAGWQESTQYSRLASITDFGPEGSPANEIIDCMQSVNDRTATSILRRALIAGVCFSPEEITETISCGNVVDEETITTMMYAVEGTYTGKSLIEILDYLGETEAVDTLIKAVCSHPTHFTEKEILSMISRITKEDLITQIITSTDAIFSEQGLNKLCDNGVDERVIKKIAKQSGIAYADPAEEEETKLVAQLRVKKQGLLSSLLTRLASTESESPQPKHSGKCDGDCAHCPPHFGYRYGRWYYGHGHMSGCERCGNGGNSGKCTRD